jgi:hypothetical protein
MSKDAETIELLLTDLDKQDDINRESRRLAQEKGLRSEVAEADRLLEQNVALRKLLLSVDRLISPTSRSS